MSNKRIQELKELQRKEAGKIGNFKDNKFTKETKDSGFKKYRDQNNNVWELVNPQGSFWMMECIKGSRKGDTVTFRKEAVESKMESVRDCGPVFTKGTKDASIRFYGENIDLTKTDTIYLKEILEELQMLHEQSDAQRLIKEELKRRRTQDSMEILRLSGFATDAEETWITMKGTHVKIEEGQSKGEAAKNFIKKKKGDKSTKKSGEVAKKGSDPAPAKSTKGGEAAKSKLPKKESKLTSSQKKVAKYLEEECELSSPEDIKRVNGVTPEKSYVESYNNALNYPVGSKVLVDGKEEVVEDYSSDDDGEVVYAELKSGDMVDASELKPIESKNNTEGNSQQTYKPGDVLKSPSDGKKIGKVEKEFKNLHGKDIIAVKKKIWGDDVTIYVPKDNVDVLASDNAEKPTPEEKKEFKKDIKKLVEIQNRIGDGKELVDAETAMKEKYAGLDLPTHDTTLGIVDWEEVLNKEIKD